MNWLKTLFTPSDESDEIPEPPENFLFSESDESNEVLENPPTPEKDQSPQNPLHHDEFSSLLRLNQPFMFRDVLVELHYREQEDSAYVTLHFLKRTASEYAANITKLFRILNQKFPIFSMSEWQNSAISWYFYPSDPTRKDLKSVKKMNEENPIYNLQHQPFNDFEEILFRIVCLAGKSEMLHPRGEKAPCEFYEIFPIPDQSVRFFVQADLLFNTNLCYIEDVVDGAIIVIGLDYESNDTYEFLSISEAFPSEVIEEAKRSLLKLREDFSINESHIAAVFKKNMINTLAIKIEDEQNDFISIFEALIEYDLHFDAQKEEALESKREQEFQGAVKEAVELGMKEADEAYHNLRVQSILTNAQILKTKILE